MLWSKPFHASSRSLALMASPPAYLKGQIWDLYDLGASHHIMPIREDFIEFQSTTPKTLTTANQQEFHSGGIGNILISIPNGCTTTTICLTSVLYTLSIGITLILVRCIDDTRYMCLFGNGCCEICRSDGELVGIIPKRQALYWVVRDINKPSAHAVKPTKLMVMDLHCCMGHITPHATYELVTKGLVTGLKIIPSKEPEKCEACIKAKLTCQDIPKVHQGKRATRFGEEVWSDLWRPLKVATLGGQKYFVSFTNDHSQWTTIYLLQMKDILEAYKTFEAWVKKHLNIGIACLHSNHGGEYMSTELIAYLDSKGTVRKLTVHNCKGAC